MNLEFNKLAHKQFGGNMVSLNFDETNYNKLLMNKDISFDFPDSFYIIYFFFIYLF